jgi:cytochrome c biogenesis protein
VESLPGRMWWRLWCFFSSLKLVVILLIAVTIVSLLGTLFPQLPPEVIGDPQASARWLAMAREKYGPLTGLYETLGLFDVYRSPWFILLIIALILNTLVCTIRRFKAIWRAITARPRLVMPDTFYFPPRVGGGRGEARIACRASLTLAQEAGAANVARRALARRRYRVLAEEQVGVTYLYAERNRWARLGTLITHLSVALIVLGFVWSQGGVLSLSKGWGWRESAVALGPGQLYQVEHGHSFQVRCDGFEVERYPGGLPKDYRARLTVLQGGSEATSKIVRINDPLSYRGIGFYLSSYGPAARVRARDALGKSSSLQVMGGKSSEGEVVLNFAGEGEGWDLLVPSLDLALHVVFYYEGPSLFVQATRGDQAVFADFIHDGETIELEDAVFEFALDRYIVLQVVSDPGFKLVISAAFLVVGGLIMSLYFPHNRIWAKVTGDEIHLAGLTVGDKVGLERELAAIVRGIERRYAQR